MSGLTWGGLEVLGGKVLVGVARWKDEVSLWMVMGGDLGVESRSAQRGSKEWIRGVVETGLRWLVGVGYLNAGRYFRADLMMARHLLRLPVGPGV